MAASSVFIGFFAFRYDHPAIFRVLLFTLDSLLLVPHNEVTTIKRAVRWVVGLMVSFGRDEQRNGQRSLYASPGINWLRITGCSTKQRAHFFKAQETYSLGVGRLAVYGH